MHKVQPIFHSGRAFVQLTMLPPSQFEYLDRNIPEVERFRLEFNDEKYDDCISYEAYENWFELISLRSYENYIDTQF